MHPIKRHILSLFDRIPLLGSTIYSTYGVWTRLYINVYTRALNLRHPASINPYQLFTISPDKIQKSRTGFWFQPISTVEAGNWDRNLELFENSIFYKSFKKHFEQGVPWVGTQLYEQKLKKLEEGSIYKYRYGDSPSEIRTRLQQIDSLYNSIQEYGYKTQRELQNYSTVALGTHRDHLPPELFEITVSLGRNGEWLFDDGRHRLTIAKILNIDAVPVRVIARHRKWQSVRNEINTHGNVQSASDKTINLSHPDIVSIRDSFNNFMIDWHSEFERHD